MFFTLNGWSIPIERGSVSVSSSRVGGEQQNARGYRLRRRSKHTRAISAKTSVMSYDDARTLSGVINGLWDEWKIDGSPVSNLGSMPVTGSSYNTAGLSAVTGFPFGYFQSVSVLFFSGFVGRTWSISMMQQNPGGDPVNPLAYDSYFTTSAGRYFKDGQLQAGTTAPFLAVQDGRFAFGLGGNFAQLKVYRFVCSDNYIAAQFHSNSELDFYVDGPSFTIDGDILMNEPSKFRGLSASVDITSYGYDGAPLHGIVSFSIEEL